VVDLSLAVGPDDEAVQHFIESERLHQVAQDEALMRRVEATRVEMETF
jgi:hypothetical protein